MNNTAPPPPPSTLTVNGFNSSYSTTTTPYQPTINLTGSGFNSITQITWSCTLPSGSSCTYSPYVWTAANWSGKFTRPNDTSASVAPTLLTGVAGEPTGTYNWSVIFSGGGQSVSKTFTVVNNTAPPPPSDTTPPTVAISSPVATGGTYNTGTATVNVSGTASDNVGVVSVYVANNRGGAQFASGTTSWSATGIALQTGANILTAHAIDAAGNGATTSITVNYTTVDTTLPSIAISSPVATGGTYNTGTATVNVSGTASDNVGVVNVTWANNRGGGGTASGTTNWSAEIALQSGANTITVSAFDATGLFNQASITVNYTVTQSTGTLNVTTGPVNGEIFVNGELYGTGWIRREVAVGSYTVSFGAVSGYTTPALQFVDVTAGEEEVITGTYDPTGPSGADLRVVRVVAFTPGDPVGLILQGEESIIRITVKNEGAQPLPLGLYTVAVYVWDIVGEGWDSTFAKRATDGLWPSQSRSSTQVALRLAPQEVKDIEIRHVFSSSFFSDRLEVRFLPPYEGAPAIDSNPDNDFGEAPITDLVFSGPTQAIANCEAEVATATFMAMTLPVVAAASAPAVAAGSIPAIIAVGKAEILVGLAKTIYKTGDVYEDLSVQLQDALRRGRNQEAGRILATAAYKIGKSFTGNVGEFLLGGFEIGWKEANDTGCLALFPSLSDAKGLVGSLIQGFAEELKTWQSGVFWFFGGSPVDLLAIDSAGRRVAVRLDGTVESEISGAWAFRIGDVATGVIALPRADTYTFQTLGLDTGTARVSVIQPRSGGSISTAIYEDVPQQPTSSASVVVDPTNTEYTLQVDLNGDGIPEELRQPNSVEVFNSPPVPPLVIATTSLPDAKAGTPYYVTLEATGGKPPYQVTLLEGALPPGLGLLGTGEIVGTPISVGEATFTMKAEDLLGSTTTAGFTLSVLPPDTPPSALLTIRSTVLPAGEQGALYGYALLADGGAPPYTWSLAGGKKNKLPRGFTLTSDGILTGTPTKAKTTSSTVQVTDATYALATKNLSLQIVKSVKIKTKKLKGGTVGTPYSSALKTAGGIAPLTFSLIGGALPPGLTLDPGTGGVSGTPTAAGAFEFVAQVTSSGASTYQKNIRIKIK